jgi:hypothetical protein
MRASKFSFHFKTFRFRLHVKVFRELQVGVHWLLKTRRLGRCWIASRHPYRARMKRSMWDCKAEVVHIFKLNPSDLSNHINLFRNLSFQYKWHDTHVLTCNCTGFLSLWVILFRPMLGMGYQHSTVKNQLAWECNIEGVWWSSGELG